jgi:hypothetical protein
MQLYIFSQAFHIFNAAILTAASLSDLGTRGAVRHPIVPSSWSGSALTQALQGRIGPTGLLTWPTTNRRGIAIGDSDRLPASLHRTFTGSRSMAYHLAGKHVGES